MPGMDRDKKLSVLPAPWEIINDSQNVKSNSPQKTTRRNPKPEASGRSVHLASTFRSRIVCSRDIPIHLRYRLCRLLEPKKIVIYCELSVSACERYAGLIVFLSIKLEMFRVGHHCHFTIFAEGSAYTKGHGEDWLRPLSPIKDSPQGDDLPKCGCLLAGRRQVSFPLLWGICQKGCSLSGSGLRYWECWFTRAQISSVSFPA